MIDGPGQPTGSFGSISTETTMLKSISAALIVASMLAVPAMAAGPGHNGKTVAPAVHAKLHVKPHARDAHAKMARHHHRHLRHHHRFH